MALPRYATTNISKRVQVRFEETLRVGARQLTIPLERGDKQEETRFAKYSRKIWPGGAVFPSMAS